ncbi:MAG: HAMP domain-containing sensor histidine kinase [Steroidobacteraceae bacterium]
MSIRPSLRRRIVLGVVCFTALVTLSTSLLGYWINEQAEQRVWESMFQSELGRRIQSQSAQDAAWSESDALQLFGAAAGRPIPREFADLGPGVHDEVKLGSGLYVVSVEGSGPARSVMALDISEMEKRESKLMLWMALAGVLVVLALAAGTYFAAQWLVRPLTQLSAMIGALRPDARGQQIRSQASDPLEVAVISKALNHYLADIDRYVEREHRFLNMASHELRTPIAVISGAAEIAIEQPNVEQARSHISRIIRVSHEMQELVALLLALARSPARLRASASRIDLARLVPRIVADHEHLLSGKELTVAFGTMPPTEVLVPEAIATAAIGNLVRNAIENSSRGTIVITLDRTGTVAVEDPGSGMSAQEQSRLHARLARLDHGQAGGIGLDLIMRLCEHLGWMLELQPRTSGGTKARLRFCPPS